VRQLSEDVLSCHIGLLKSSNATPIALPCSRHRSSGPPPSQRRDAQQIAQTHAAPAAMRRVQRLHSWTVQLNNMKRQPAAGRTPPTRCWSFCRQTRGCRRRWRRSGCPAAPAWASWLCGTSSPTRRCLRCHCRSSWRRLNLRYGAQHAARRSYYGFLHGVSACCRRCQKQTLGC